MSLFFQVARTTSSREPDYTLSDALPLLLCYVGCTGHVNLFPRLWFVFFIYYTGILPFFICLRYATVSFLINKGLDIIWGGPRNSLLLVPEPPRRFF